ncbi:hypothetical protein NA2_18235 [Nitratireductor pacificus pht-3B]|uniref:Uncharacterized protein n=1 Tax=Nitratireductor pacificus pht-3B TaxID=391937 RepID=K2MJJ6_9HYPH|nr:hypothetical protein NA2_18235 [Nitratireductor pacificus pht-3B]
MQAVALAAAFQAVADERQGRLVTPLRIIAQDPAIDVRSLYRNRVAVLSSYADAMAVHRRYALGFADGQSYGPGFLDATLPGAWTFLSPSGDEVERRRDGTLTISRNNYLANWYAEVDCRVIDWPQLACRDGRQRSISAPDASSVRIDGQTFHLSGGE